MLLAFLVTLSLASTEARDLDLLDGGAQTWLSSDRVSRCPVHGKIEPAEADGGKGVSFVVKVQPGKRFSLLEKNVPAGGLQDFAGLQLNFTTSGLGSWKLRLYDRLSNVYRFSYIINKLDGAHSLTLPWSSFRAEGCRRRKTNTNGYSVQPSSISHLAIWVPNGAQQAQLTFQNLHAVRDLPAMALAATGAATDGMAEGFEGPFVGMGITGHNDFPLTSVNSPAECAEACTKTAGCRSFDYGARGQVLGECWLSLADRASAGYAFQSWELYNYYEIKGASSDAAMMSTDIEVMSENDMAAVMEYFDGPFIGMGITGHNDFAPVSVSGPADCAEACTQTGDCSSFDYGARGQVLGECRLSLADRKSAGNASESLAVYDYYELKGTDNTPTEDANQATASMEAAQKDEMAAANGDDVSHAQRPSRKLMACVQAIGAIAIFLAS